MLKSKSDATDSISNLQIDVLEKTFDPDDFKVSEVLDNHQQTWQNEEATLLPFPHRINDERRKHEKLEIHRQIPSHRMNLKRLNFSMKGGRRSLKFQLTG